MRFFIARNGSTVIDKQVYAGDDVKADALVARYLVIHPDFTVQEVDQTVFDTTIMMPIQTQAQRDWTAFKASSPTAFQAIIYLAKMLGLE